MFMFPAIPIPGVVHCLLFTVRTNGPPHEGRLPFPRKFSMKMISDCNDFGTTGQRGPNATSLHKNEFHLINIYGVINLQTSCFSSMLLPAQRWWIVCCWPYAPAAPLAKVGSLFLQISVWKWYLIATILVKLGRGDPVLLPCTRMSFI